MEYAGFIHEEWKALDEISLSKIPSWSEGNLSPYTKQLSTLFYPFGGPDIAYALKLFPNVEKYILVGLEPIGNFDSLIASIESTNSSSTFLAVKKAFSSYLKKGYFITSEMGEQLCNGKIRGTIYMILIELAKSGFCVNLIEDLSINSKGEPVPRQKGLMDCIRITFTPNEGGKSKIMYYVRTDLSNSNRALSCLTNLVKGSPFATFIKSASYALHDNNFSNLRSFILENTAAILQDDTGIPFRYFQNGKNAPKTWEVLVFGKYTHPTLPCFSRNIQKDLSSYYATNSTIEIPFRIGYGFTQDRPNLLLAVPFKSQTTEKTPGHAN